MKNSKCYWRGDKSTGAPSADHSATKISSNTDIILGVRLNLAEKFENYSKAAASS